MLYEVKKLSISSCSITGVVGSNGVGKTTFLKILMGISSYDKGSCKVFKVEAKTKKQGKLIGAALDEIQLMEYLSGEENLIFFSKIYNASNTDVKYITEKLNLEKDIKKRVKNCSMGQKKKLLIAIALLSKPTILILDEPLNGIDSTTSNEIKKILKNLKSKMTIIITSHDEGDINELCDSVIKISNKKIEPIEINLKSKLFFMLEVNNSKKAKQLIDDLNYRTNEKVNIIDNNNIEFNSTKKEIVKIIRDISLSLEVELYQLQYRKFEIE